MKIQVQFGKPGDMSRIIECADQCFGFTTEKTSFRMCGAKFYGDAMETSDKHLLATMDGELAGLVGLCPETMLVNGETLSLLGIGTVCTKPEARGNGVMQKMLNGCNKVLADWDCDLAFLAGKYERYHHFGYEFGGSTYRYSIARSSEQGELVLRPIVATDTAVLGQCLTLHDRSDVRVIRRQQELYGILTQWHRQPYGVWSDEHFIGYLTYGVEEHNVEEIELADWHRLDEVLQAAMWQLGVEQILLDIPGYRSDLREEADCLAAGVWQKPEIMLQIRRFDKLLRIFLPLRKNLCDGMFVLDIQERERLVIAVKQGIVTVERTEQTADLSLDWADATRLLFGMLPQECIPADKRAFCNACFPLDFMLMYDDQF